MIMGGAFFCIGAILCAFAQDLAMLIIGRVCLGAGVGFANQVCLLTAELNLEHEPVVRAHMRIPSAVHCMACIGYTWCGCNDLCCCTILCLLCYTKLCHYCPLIAVVFC